MRGLQVLQVAVTFAAIAAAQASPGVPGSAEIPPLGSLPDLAQEICPQPDFLGDYPKDEELPWSENVQGVAHDDAYWFFTQQNALLRLPASFSLHRDPNFRASPNGELRRSLHSYPGLAGFNHFGDIDQFGGFVFAPLEKPPTIRPPREPRAAIAVFDPSDLHLVSVVDVTSIMGAKAGELAIDPWTGYLYTSPSHVSDDPATYLYRFTIDLGCAGGRRSPGRAARVQGSGHAHGGRRQPADQGAQAHAGRHVHAVGRPRHRERVHRRPAPGGTRRNPHLPARRREPAGDRIHARDRVMLVTESVDEKGLGGFKFAYDPALDLTRVPHAPNNDEEPEGIDWWNRGPASAAAGARGQLHGIMIDNTQFLHGESNPDDLYFKHYAIDYSCLPDCDGDGLPTSAEVDENGTDPLDADTDGDHIPDGDEVDLVGNEPILTRPALR